MTKHCQIVDKLMILKFSLEMMNLENQTVESSLNKRIDKMNYALDDVFKLYSKI